MATPWWQLQHKAALRLAAERLARFEKLRKVDFSRMHPDELIFVRGPIHSGVAHTGGKFRFRCPVCGRIEINDQEMEPACTGPSWTDDHPLEPMERVPR